MYCLQEEEDLGRRQVLVLGLDGAGKSSMLQGLTFSEATATAKRRRCRPTRGFNFMSLNSTSCQLDFLESKTFPSSIYLCPSALSHRLSTEQLPARAINLRVRGFIFVSA